MVIITTQEKSHMIFEKYNTNIAAFTTGKSKGIKDADIEISFAKLHILPDEDEVNAVINGDVKDKKVIRDAVKSLMRPSLENKDLCIAMAQIVNMISMDRKLTKKEVKNIKRNGPNVIVIVLEDANNDPVIKAKNKFYKKYLEAVFGVFGIEPVSDEKVLKKLFKKGKSKKVVNRVANFIRANDKVRVNGKGAKHKKLLFGFYAVELQQAAMYNLATNDQFKPSRQEKEILVKTILDVYTNDNFKILGDMKDGKKLKKAIKNLKEKNEVAVDAYNEFVEILNTAMGTDMDMPKVKNGYKKKKGKKGPKMNVKKFVKFFTRKKCTNFDILELLYAHTSLALCDVAIGAKEYNKVMSTVINYAGFDENFSKVYVAAAKKLAIPADTTTK